MKGFFNKVFPTSATKILGFVYIGLVIWWLTIFLRGIQETNENFLYSLVYGLIPLACGVYGMKLGKLWGSVKSSMGRSVTFLSAGMFAWAIGNLIWGYYNLVLGIAVPYPSIADGIFILSFPLWAIGMSFFSRTTGMNFSIRRVRGKLALFIIPIAAIVFSYYLLFVVARGGVLDFEGGLTKLFLDIAFPIGDVVILTLALLIYGLSLDYLGGRYKLPIFILLFGFVINYIADFSFSYTTTLETFFVGNWVDLLFATSMFIIAFGITSLDPRLLKSEERNNTS